MSTKKRLSIPEAVKLLREGMSLTQEKFAAQLDVTLRTVSRWELYEGAISSDNMEKLWKLARSYGISDARKAFFEGSRLPYLGNLDDDETETYELPEWGDERQALLKKLSMPYNLATWLRLLCEENELLLSRAVDYINNGEKEEAVRYIGGAKKRYRDVIFHLIQGGTKF